MHLPKIVLYNKEQLNNFKNEDSHATFLDNIGLTSISESFSNDQSKLDNEILYFRALHYIKYRLELSIQQNKEILFWNKSYTRLRNRLTVSNKGLVYSCYKKSNIIHDATRGYDDYISMGYDALIRAVDTFDPWQTCRFSTFACTCIIRSMKKASQKRNRGYIDVYNLDPTTKEEDCDSEYYIEKMLSSVNNLTEQEKDILYSRFYLGDRLSDLGEKYNRTKERIRQIEKSALEKLHKMIKE